MFETLLESDTLFENPGLLHHDHARQYLEARENPPMNGRPAHGNSLEIGFKSVMRSIFKDVFKIKSRGLVLRNFEAATVHQCPKDLRKRMGQFLDEIISTAEVKESSSGRFYMELDRFRLEEIKESKVSFLTDTKTGTYPIDIYCQDVLLYKNGWLITLLEHNTYSWESITMMRHKTRSSGYPLQRFFYPNEINQYNDAQNLLLKIFRDATVVKPGKISRALTTPLNSSWTWDEVHLTIMPKEVWSEDNIKSEIAEPISINQAIDILLDSLANTDLRFNGARSDLVYDYHRSLCDLVDDPPKLLKIIAQLQGRVEVTSKERPDAFLNREKDDPKILQYPSRNDPSYRGES